MVMYMMPRTGVRTHVDYWTDEDPAKGGVTAWVCLLCLDACLLACCELARLAGSGKGVLRSLDWETEVQVR